MMRSLVLLGLVGLVVGQDLSDHLYLNILSRSAEGAIESSRRSGLKDIININLPEVCTARACEVCRLQDNKVLLDWQNQDVSTSNETTVFVAQLIDCLTVYGPDRCSYESEAVTVRFNDPSVPAANMRQGVVGVNVFLEDLCDCMDCPDFEPEVLEVSNATLSGFGDYLTVEFNTPVFLDAFVDREVGDEFPLSEVISQASIDAHLGAAGNWRAKWTSVTSLKIWANSPELSMIRTGNAYNGFNLSTVPGALYPRNWAFPHNDDPTLAFNFRVAPPQVALTPVTSFTVADRNAPKTNCRSFNVILIFADGSNVDTLFSLTFNVPRVDVSASLFRVPVIDLPMDYKGTNASFTFTFSNWVGSWSYTATVSKVWTPAVPGNDVGSCLACVEEGCDVCYGNYTGPDCDMCLPTYGDTWPSCVRCKAHRTGPKCERCIAPWTGPDCTSCPLPFKDTFGTCACPSGQTGPNCTVVPCPAVGYTGVAPACVCAPGYNFCSFSAATGTYSNANLVACPAVGYQGTSPSCTCKQGFSGCRWFTNQWFAASPVACPATGYQGTTPNCTCAAGYGGCLWNATSLAWTTPSLVNLCAASPCKHGGNCTSNAGVSFTCQCTDDYRGATCDIIKVVRPDLVPDGKAIVSGSINIGVPTCTLDDTMQAAFSRVMSTFIPGTTADNVKVSNYSVSNCTAGRRLLAAAHVATINYYAIVNRSDADAARAALTALAANATALAELNAALMAEGVASEDSDTPELSPITQVVPPPTDCEMECDECNCETGTRNCTITVEPKNGGNDCGPATCSCETEPTKKKLSGGAIAGIVIGSVAFVFFVSFFAWYICCKKSKKEEPTTNAEETGLAKDEEQPADGGGAHVAEV